MPQDNDQIEHLIRKLNLLMQRHDQVSKEMQDLRAELHQYMHPELISHQELATDRNTDIPKVPIPDEYVEVISKPAPPTLTPIPGVNPVKKNAVSEKYIGENIISKIGIAILVIGVGIGAKYSIDHDLISPLTRILLGYAVGIGLALFGIRLKKSYADFSAVLVSGAIAIMYFITYAAYSFYSLMPQWAAFALMVIMTGLTVFAAIRYDKQVIAHIGLVGAYGIPFLLGRQTSDVVVLYTYMAIINIGILSIALMKYWKSLYYSSFALTWLIFSMWYFIDYEPLMHRGIFWAFGTIFFATFYLTFIAYKLKHQEKFQFEDILLILANSFVFYGLGFAALNNFFEAKMYLGLFTLGNALLHACVSIIVYSRKLYDRNLFYLIAGLALIFITIAIPVQLDGNWVTLLWAGEADLLFWISRSRKTVFYEKLAYGMMLLALASMVGDWTAMQDAYNVDIPETRRTPFLNVSFLTSLLFIGCFAFIFYTNKKTDVLQGAAKTDPYKDLINFMIPAVMLLVIYCSIRIEISIYWEQLYADSAKTITPDGQEYPSYYQNEDYRSLKSIWLINYSLAFFAILMMFFLKYLKERSLQLVLIGLSAACILVFLSQGLYELSELRDNYLDPTLSEYPKHLWNVYIRYISYLFAAFLLFVMHRFVYQHKAPEPQLNLKVGFDILLHSSILWVASSELITILEMMHSNQSNKLGLSILWGLYALLLIAIGIWKNKKHLRIGAIVLFAVTLIKLIVYDLTHLDTISKTIVFVSLGLLLLIISFLYNKYKHLTSPET